MTKARTQAKFTVDADIASAFKSRCESEGVSMASVIQQFMKTGRPAGKTGSKTSTRPLRRKTVLEIIGALSGIMDLEAEYRDSIPEQFAQRYEAADHACERLAEAVACLEDAF